MIDPPIKTHPDDIAWYLETAPKFGEALKRTARHVRDLYKPIEALEVEKIFMAGMPRYNGHYPFWDQKNSLGENFPLAICISVNECVAHGMTNILITPGDIVTIDAGFQMEAPSGRQMFFDAAITVYAGNLDTDQTLLSAPKLALEEIQKLQGKINTLQISSIIEKTAKEASLNIVTGLTGHGIGYGLHLAPRISNVIDPRMGDNLVPGTFICPEPMYTANGCGESEDIYIDADGWSVMTDALSSHWETVFYYDGNSLRDTVGILSPL